MLEIVKDLLQEVDSFIPKSEKEVEDFRLKFLGKKGKMNELFAVFKSVPNESKKEKSRLLSKVNKAGNKVKDKNTIENKESDEIKETSNSKKPKRIRKTTSKVVEEKPLDSKKNESKEPKRTGWWSANNK